MDAWLDPPTITSCKANEDTRVSERRQIAPSCWLRTVGMMAFSLPFRSTVGKAESKRMLIFVVAQHATTVGEIHSIAGCTIQWESTHRFFRGLWVQEETEIGKKCVLYSMVRVLPAEYLLKACYGKPQKFP